MTRAVKVIVAAALLGIAMAPSRASAQAPAAVPRLASVELPAELDRVLRDYERAWSGGDADALAALFTEDGYVSNAAGWVSGHPAIRAQYANAGGDLRLRALSYAIGDSAAWIVGAYGYGAEAESRDGGKFILALRRGPDGRWLISADLDNSNRPASPQ